MRDKHEHEAYRRVPENRLQEVGHSRIFIPPLFPGCDQNGQESKTVYNEGVWGARHIKTLEVKSC